MKKFKKGFTLIELLVVIAIVGILATTLAPKLFLNLRKGTMATVQHNLGVIRSRLSIDHLNDQYPDLVNGDATLLSAYTIEDTPIFTDANDVTHQPTNKVVTTRDNTGGWVYYRDTGKVYANLPNGAYTKLPGFEIWTPGLTDYSGTASLSVFVGETGQIDTPADPVPSTAIFPEATYELQNPSDSSIATVSPTGLVTGVSVGEIVVLQTVSPLVGEVLITVTIRPVIFNDDTAGVTELANSPDNTSVSGNLGTNDEATAIGSSFGSTSASPMNGTYGSLSINSDGSYTYNLDNSNAQVNALATGGTLTETFNVDMIENLSSRTGQTKLDITITGVNDGPDSSSISLDAVEDTTLIVTQAMLLAGANDIDSDNSTLVAENVQPGNADTTVVNNGDGTFSITPSNNVNGDLPLTFDISDGEFSSANTITLAVSGTAEAPTFTFTQKAQEMETFSDQNITGSGANATLSGWGTDNPDGWMEASSEATYIHDANLRDNRGTVVELERNNGDPSNIFQDIEAQPGEKIRLVFDLSRRSSTSLDNSVDDQRVNVLWEGNLIQTISPTQVKWISYIYDFDVTTANPRVELAATSKDGFGAVLDTITVSKTLSLLYADDPIDVTLSAQSVGQGETIALEFVELLAGTIVKSGGNSFTATSTAKTVDVTNWNLDTLSVTPPSGFTGSFEVKTTATATETANGSTAVSSASQVFDIVSK